MPLAIAFEEAKAKQVRHEGDGSGTTGGVTQTPFFGSEDHPDLPEANLSHRDPGRVSYPHYHLRDQFQVVVGGTGPLGRHNLAPCSVHFARAYTPYGPLASNPSTPFTAFVLRPHYDPGSQHLPEAKDKLNEVPDRRPWQIVRQATFPALQSGTATADAVLQAIPGIKDEQGLAAYTLAMKPNAQARAPDPSDGDGQYLIVVKGSLLHGDKEYKTWGLVFVGPNEGPFQVHAGAEGLEALVLNFPRPRTRVADATESVQAATGLKTWQCTLCAFVYDEAAGIPEEGIAPGTRWQDVPDTWSCPDCSASKADFQMVELKN